MDKVSPDLQIAKRTLLSPIINAVLWNLPLKIECFSWSLPIHFQPNFRFLFSRILLVIFLWQLQLMMSWFLFFPWSVLSMIFYLLSQPAYFFSSVKKYCRRCWTNFTSSRTQGLTITGWCSFMKCKNAKKQIVNVHEPIKWPEQTPEVQFCKKKF